MARSFSDLISDISIAEQGSTGSRSFSDLLSALESQSASERQFSQSFDFVGPVRPGEEYSPEFMGPIAPPSPRDALQRQVDATIAARETSQRYATLPKRVADVYNVYKNEDLAREALDLADQLKIEYPEYGEDIEDLLMKGLRPEDIRTQITQKRERKRRQSELATQYPDFARDVDKLFKEGFSPEDVTLRMEAMAGAKARVEQRKAEEAATPVAKTEPGRELAVSRAQTDIYRQAAIRIGQLENELDSPSTSAADIEDRKAKRQLINSLKKSIEPVADQPAIMAGLEQLYQNARGFATGGTFGLLKPVFAGLEEATGGRIEQGGLGETVSELGGTLATGIGSAAALAPRVAPVFGGLSPIAQRAATAATVGAIQSGTQSAIALATGEDISAKDAAANIGQSILSSAIAAPIAATVPGRVLNAASQIAGDFVVDLAADVGYRERLKDQRFVDWLLKEELPNLAVSIAGAGKDVLDARAAKTEIRRLFDQRMRSGAATPPPPTRAEAPAPELVTRPVVEPEATAPARDFVLDPETGRPVEGAGVGTTDDLFKIKLKSIGYSDDEAARALAEFRNRGDTDSDIEENIKDIEYAQQQAADASEARRKEATETARRAREDVEFRRRQIEERAVEPTPRPEPAPAPEPARVEEVATPAPQPQRLEDLDLGNLRAEIDAIASYQGKQKRLNDLAEQFGVPTGGTPKEILGRIEEAYNAAKERQVTEGGVGEYRGDGARVQEEGQDRIVTPEVQEGRPEAGGGYRPATGGNVPPGPVGRGVQGQQAVTPPAGGAVPLTTPPPAAGGAAGAAGAPAPLPGGQKRFGFIGPTKQKKSVEIDESISPNVRAVDDALERQQRDLERLSMGKGRKSFDSIAEGLWDSQSLAKRKLIASELKDAESRLILRKGWAANAKDQYDERISAIDKLITHGNEKSFSEYLEMRRLVEVADLKNAKGEDYDLPYGITPEQAKEWISTFENQKSADGTLNTYKAAADEYYKAARQQLDEMRAEGLLTKEGYASLVQNHKNYSPQQMIDKLDPENSSGLAKPGAGAPIKALKGGSESGRVIDYRYLLARTIAAAQNRIFTNRANKELVSGVQKGGEKVAKEIGAIIDDGSFDKIPAGYERIKSFDDGIEKSIFVPKEFAKSWNESDPGLNKATAEFLRTWSGSRVVKAMATGYNPEFILSNFPRDAAYAWFRTGEYSPILPIGAVQQVKDYVDTAKDAFRKSGIYKDYLKEGGGLDGLSAEGRLDKNPWDKVTPTTQTAKDLARWASFLGEFSERWTRLAVYNRAIKNGKSKMEAAKIARDMLDFSQGGKLVKGVDTVVPYLNAMTQGTRGLANSFTENGLGKQSFKAAQVMAIAAGLGSVAREYFNEQWNAISDQEKASKWIIPLPGSYKDDEGKTRYRYLAIPKDQGQAVFAAMSDAMVGAMRGEKPDAKALLFALKQAVPDVTAGSPIGNAALAYFNNLDTFRMEEVYRGRPTTPSAEFSGNAAFDESMRKLSEISGGAIEISPARLKRATEKVILPHNPFTIMTGLAANQLLPEELRAEANEFAIENQPFIRRFLRSTQPIEVPASVAEKAERLGLEMGDKPGKQVRREVYQAERELGAKRNVQDKEIRKIMSGIKSGRTSYRDLLRYIDETPEEDRNRIRRRMNDIQEEYGLEFDFSGSDIGLPKLSELRGGLKTIK